MQVSAIVVAAGSGTRAKMNPPKQFQMFGGVPVLAQTLKIFLSHPNIQHVTVVIAPDHQSHFENIISPFLTQPVSVAPGGDSRTASVMSGLKNLPPDVATTHVLIHDGVRPFVSPTLIDRVITALQDHVAVVPSLPISDALWRSDGQSVLELVERDGFARVQTPQGFKLATLLDAYRMCQDDADDDAAVVASAGFDVRQIRGHESNMKLTSVQDFEFAKQFQPRDVRSGVGFDVHQFGEGQSLTLCGVKISCGKSLVGHSDADVATHAITDALYGAMAQGDIGRWFPPSDPQWKGADSMMFLSHAGKLACDLGYAIQSIDCTIICETPRIAPHADDMRAQIASGLEIDIDRVSIKGTTSEQLGFTGRGEGIAAMSSAMLSAR